MIRLHALLTGCKHSFVCRVDIRFLHANIHGVTSSVIVLKLPILCKLLKYENNSYNAR
jgi:hypothetical protein